MALTLLAIGLTAVMPVRAEPAFAVRNGFSCGQCHVNRVGGGLRTPFGSLHGQTVLPARQLEWQGRGYLLPADPEARFAVGGDLRFGFYAAAPETGDSTATFALPSADLYAQFRAVPERLELYLDQRVGSGATSTRELFALWTFADRRGHVKAGRFVPPYGWALPDDSAFVREPLGFAFTGSDLGVETGFDSGRWSAQLAVVNGSGGPSDVDTNKKLTLLATRRFRGSRIGLSAAHNVTGGTETTWAGLLGGLNVGRVSLWGEADRRRSDPGGETWAALLEANLLIRRGVSLTYTHDWIDPDRDVATDERSRDALAFEYVPYPFVQLRALLRRGDGPPSVEGARDRQAELEVHLYF